MYKKEEFPQIIIALIILVFVLRFNSFATGNLDYIPLLLSTLVIALILFATISAKKLVAYYFGAELEVRIWQMKRFGVKPHHHLKGQIPIGIILPFFVTLLSYGYLPWVAVMESDITGTSARAAKRHDKYKFTEMTDVHLSLITSAGVITSLILAVIGYIANVPELALWGTYYAAFSLIPLGNLDGSKIFFGSRIIWITLIAFVAIFLYYAMNRNIIVTIATILILMVIFILSKKIK